jgi:hypothetical protein
MEERGRLQICTRPPDEIAFDWRRFYFFEIEKMVAYAIHHGELGLNVYMEGRTLQASTKKRGKLPETCATFALVTDSDSDKGKGSRSDKASLTVASSIGTGNRHYWYFLDQGITDYKQAQALGAQMRAALNTDGDTGVVTQPYRLAGTWNYPDSKKRARGRTSARTAILAHRGGRGWTVAQLQAAFPARTVRAERRATRVVGETVPVLEPSPLPPERIARRYPIPSNIRDELLHGNPGMEDCSLAFWKFMRACCESAVPIEEAFTLVSASAFRCARWDDASVEQQLRKAYARGPKKPRGVV